MLTSFEGLETGSLEDWRALQEFPITWDFLVRFFTGLYFPNARRTLELLAQLRAHGFDRTLRAGSSLSTVVFSRSRLWGLRGDQPYVELYVEQDSIQIKSHSIAWDHPYRVSVPDLGDELPNVIIQLLRQLERKPLS